MAKTKEGKTGSKLEGKSMSKRLEEIEVLIAKYNSSSITLHRVKKTIFRKLHAIKKKYGIVVSITSSEGSLSLKETKENSDG